MKTKCRWVPNLILNGKVIICGQRKTGIGAFIIVALFGHLTAAVIVLGDDGLVHEKTITGFESHLGFDEDTDRTLPISIGPVEYWSAGSEKFGEHCRSLLPSSAMPQTGIKKQGYIYVKAFLQNDAGFPKFPLNVALRYQTAATNQISVSAAARDKRFKWNFTEIGTLRSKTNGKWMESVFKISPERLWAGNTGAYVFKIESPDFWAEVSLAEIRVFAELPCVELCLSSNNWHVLTGYKRRAYACNIAEEKPGQPCLEISCLAGGEGAGFMQLAKPVNVKSNASYALIYEVRTVDCLRPFIMIYQLDGQGRRVSPTFFYPSAGTYEWRLFTGEFKTLPGIAGLNVYFMNKDSGLVRYRNIKLVHLPEDGKADCGK